MSWEDLADVLLQCTSIDSLKGKTLTDITAEDKHALLLEQPIHFNRRFRSFCQACCNGRRAIWQS